MSAVHIIKKAASVFPERHLSKATVLCGVKQKRSAFPVGVVLEQFKDKRRVCKSCLKNIRLEVPTSV